MLDIDNPAKRAAQFGEAVRKALGYTQQGFTGKGLQLVADSDLRAAYDPAGIKEEDEEIALVDFIGRMERVSGIEGVGLLSSDEFLSGEGLRIVVFNRWKIGTEEASDAYTQAAKHDADLERVLSRCGIRTKMTLFAVKSAEGLEDAAGRFNHEFWHTPETKPLGLIRFHLPKM